MADIIHVQVSVQFAEVARLARETWQQHYTPIIGAAQVEYMLEKFQSEEAIAEQIASGYEYYLLAEEHGHRGYMAVLQNEDESSLLLSKLYVLDAARGRGYGAKLLNFAEGLCRKRQLKTLWLTVNKNNTASINWYVRMGFINAGPIVQDIGGGFMMDDFRMEKDSDTRLPADSGG